MKRRTVTILLLLLCIAQLRAQVFRPDSTLKALVVIAHPDDEAAFSGTIYKISKEHHGQVDICVITNGEAGFKYSTLAEAYYGLNLTDEKEGRKNLPRIRKQELMNAGRIIGVNNIFFLDQQDAKNSLDEHEPLDTSWNTALVMTRLKEIMTRTRYDFVFCLMPTPGTHAGHKAASLSALRTVKALPEAQRPVILGGSWALKTDKTPKTYQRLKNYAETDIVGDTALYRMDRTQPFGYNNQLNYNIITNWEIAEHKSQGAMQNNMGRSDYEVYYLFRVNNAGAAEKARQLFEKLRVSPYVPKQY
jgi:LmbE family N-acetylglucosaminyl deacetylase